MVNIYSEKEIAIMAQGGKILNQILKKLIKQVKPGITTKYLDKVAEDLIFSFGAKPSFKGFNGYPTALCTSINEEIVHAVPSKRILKDGDILTLDLGIRYKNYCTDMAITVGVGRIDRKLKKLIAVTKKSLEFAIKQCRAGNRLGDIGWAIENYVKKNKFNVIRDLVGHGVGKSVHEDPLILNYGEKGEGMVLKPGMVLALEPMVSIGNYEIEKCADGFAYRTKDHSISAHFEHTIAITKKGAKILTK